MKHDLRVQWQLFAAVAGFIALLALVYWFVSYEDAGTTMLALAAGLAALIGGWLFRQDRPSSDHESRDDGTHYLPMASVWPLGIGIGLTLTIDGLILGWPYAVPGAGVLGLAVAGFTAQSRRRD